MLAVHASALALSGCASLESDADTTPEPVDLDGVSFTATGTLELAPRQEIEIGLSSAPGAAVSLFFLGSANDASLDAGVVEADASGHAAVVLTAPSQPTTFTLRAQLADGSTDELSVSVSEQGFTKVHVVPSYGGARKLDGTWSADVVVGGDCGALLAGYPEAPIGGLHVDAAPGLEPTVGSVPVGPTLAVAVRSGLLVQGCTTYVAKQANALEEVSVEVLDNPLVLAGAKLDVTLGFSPDPQTYTTLVAQAAGTVADVSFPPGAPVSTLLLDGIEAQVSAATASELASLRQSTSLEADVALSLEGVDLNAACRALTDGATASAVSDAASNTSGIVAQVEGAADSNAVATLRLSTFQGLDAESVGTPLEIPVAWQANGDFLLLSGTIPVSTTRLAGAYMNHEVALMTGDSATVPTLLSGAVDCPAVAGLLAAQNLPGCDAACFESACQDAIDARWALGLAAGDGMDGPLGRIDVSLGADVVVGSELLPASAAGSWTGSLSDDSVVVSCDGAVVGQAPPPQ